MKQVKLDYICFALTLHYSLFHPHSEQKGVSDRPIGRLAVILGRHVKKTQ